MKTIIDNLDSQLLSIAHKTRVAAVVAKFNALVSAAELVDDNYNSVFFDQLLGEVDSALCGFNFDLNAYVEKKTKEVLNEEIEQA